MLSNRALEAPLPRVVRDEIFLKKNCVQRGEPVEELVTVQLDKDDPEKTTK